MKTILTVIGLLILGIQSNGQAPTDFCLTIEPSGAWESEFQKLIAADKSTNSSNTYIIPVIFHVIHGGEPVGTFPNILQGQILSQITILNQDFSGNAYNASNYPQNAFVNWAIAQNIPAANLDSLGRIKIADFNIQFCLATLDSNGNVLPEPGINRINYQSLGLPSPAGYSTQATMRSYLDNILKPQTIWDVRKYLNVWITDKNSALSYAGVSTGPPLSGLTDLPNTATESTDGIWCYTKVIGSNALFPSGSYIAPFIDGRTLTHEAGHYVGLRHIWGNGECGNDFCNDTPPAAAQNSGTPNYPHNIGSCASPSNTPDGEMFMNFMDYTRGPGVYMFTTDQRSRARTAMQNSPFRNQLGTHGLCSASTVIYNESLKNDIIIYPNPASKQLNINVSQNEIDEVSIYNLLGQTVITVKNNNSIDISGLPNGIYIVRVTQGQNKNTQKFVKE
jgi:hypothetical protein